MMYSISVRQYASTTATHNLTVYATWQCTQWLVGLLHLPDRSSLIASLPQLLICDLHHTKGTVRKREGLRASTERIMSGGCRGFCVDSEDVGWMQRMSSCVKGLGLAK